MPDPRAYILAQVATPTLKPLAGVEGAFIRQISAADMDGIARADTGNSATLLLRHGVVGADGAPLFTDADVEALGKLKAHVFNDITNQVAEYNAYSDPALEDLAKN